ncbi:RNA-binding protein [Alkalilimnicola ehrlichii]|uniref:Heat shock protein 15 n=1 Tax=Alkalilimnicola ehrlichii TaxID=351052 RepID=A0A3E0WHB5_9GAMM|nr:S4 domain-containing protein [Alkalilimnicola ehrlichii]RFA29053.1 RNA-binding protein [Alkalilimnicola ehrlichii]RFA31839.1 RNA-binding protein [Alkalilimnicola ehrlichii]
MAEEGVRLDKWLWAARFFKTRRLAVEAISGGKVHVDGVRAKPAKTVRVGSEVRIRKGPFEHCVFVRELSEQRGPAAVAQTLYEETAASKEAVASQREQMKLQAAGQLRAAGKPNKRDRRNLQAFKKNRLE